MSEVDEKDGLVAPSRDESVAVIKHTPGPWAVRPQAYDDWGMVRGADGMPVALCATQPRGVEEFRKSVPYGTPEYDEGPPEVAANARLIAAAPDFYEIARRLVKMFGDTPPDELAIQVAEDPSTLTEFIELSRAAIKKTTGD